VRISGQGNRGVMTKGSTGKRFGLGFV